MKNPLFAVMIGLVPISGVVAQVAQSVKTIEGVLVDTSTFLNDYNQNGVPDILEDFSGDGFADALGFLDFDGRLLLWVDYNGDGAPDGFTDFNGSGVPDAFEDYNGSGIPDAFETGFLDTTGTGIPDFFERIYPTPIDSDSHPDPRYGYRQSTLLAAWDSSAFPDIVNGWMWLVDKDWTTEITLQNGNFLPTGRAEGVERRI